MHVMKTKLPLSLLLFLSIFYTQAFSQTTINIGGVEYKADTLEYSKVGPGTHYTAMHYYTSTVKLRTFYLEIDATNPYISFEAVHGKDSLITTERISSMAQRKSIPGKNYFGGANADFFATSGNVGYPVHGSVVEGQMGRTPNNTAHLAFSGKDVLIDNMKHAGSKLTFNGNSYTINGINVDRGENKLVLYNTLRGNYTRTNDYGVEVLVNLSTDDSWIINKKLKATVASISDGKGNTKVAPLQAVLSGHGTAADNLRALSVGDEVELFIGITNTVGTTENITALVGGDRITLLDGIVQDNDWVDRHPRTAVGYSADKTKVYFCVIDGRSTISSGLSTKHMADIMKHIGASVAINLDGGGSSGLYIDKLGIRNDPSDNSERAVCNGIFAVDVSQEDDVIAEILPAVRSVKLPQYGTFTPIIYGYNQYGKLIDVDVKNVSYTCDPAVGSMNTPTTFFAGGDSDGMLIAKYGELETGIHIQYLQEDKVELRLDSVVLDGFADYSIEVNSTVGKETFPLSPNALTWTIDDPDICSVNEGVLTGLKGGTTWAHGTLNSLNCTLKVIVERPTERYSSLLPITEDSGWGVASSSNISNMAITPEGFTYTYASGRSPYLELTNSLRLYSLPDAIRIVMNVGNAGISKVQLATRDNQSNSNTVYEYTQTVPTNQDVTIELKMSELLGKQIEHALFPVRLYSIKFPLTASANTAGDNAIKFKNLDMVYNNLSVGFSSIVQMNSLSIYPNPTKDGKIYIALNDDDKLIKSVYLYDMSGKQLEAIKELNTKSTEMSISYPSGMYMLTIITDDNQSETVKIMIAQ